MTEKRLPRKKETRWFFWGSLSALAASLGYVFWQVFSYGRRLLRQPALSVTPAPQPTGQTALESPCYQIAVANLRAGIETRRLPDGQEKLVLCAGIRNFREPWARDFGFASFGLVELGEFQAVQETLEVFLLNQKPSGQFPVKVHSTNFVDRYLHSLFKRQQPISAPIKPKYITAHNTISPDGNALLIIALLNYAQRSGDANFARQHWEALKRAVFWFEEQEKEADGLIHQPPYADWADSVARSGRVLYTNVLYWKAMRDLAAAAQRYGMIEDRPYLQSKAEKIKASINAHFWRADLGYYITSQYFDNLSSSGNLLAVSWGLTTPAQAHSILDKMNEFDMANPVPTQVVHRAYPDKFIAIENRLGGIANYHTSAAWLWLGAWHVIALTRTERLDEARTLLRRIAHVIVRDGAVHEVYAPDGEYLSTFWYTSEAPLTWSAGMVVYAYHVFHRWVGSASSMNVE